jgi:hypothetical protein
MKKEAPMKAAAAAIDREDVICFDVAAENGQQFHNVKHLGWFKIAVAKAMGKTWPTLTNPQLELLIKLRQAAGRPTFIAEYYKPLSKLLELGFVEKSGDYKYVVTQAGKNHLEGIDR